MKRLLYLTILLGACNTPDRKLEHPVRVLADADTFRDKDYHSKADDHVKAGDTVGLWLEMTANSGWTPILLKNGHRGFIKSKYLSDSTIKN